MSEPSDQSPMAFPDYEQTVWDQRSILVLVNSIGPRLNEDKFQDIFDQISAVNEINVEISANRDPKTIASQVDLAVEEEKVIFLDISFYRSKGKIFLLRKGGGF